METPLFVFAHGAGASLRIRGCNAGSERLATIGTVAAFDYAYIRNLNRRPDPLPKLVATIVRRCTSSAETQRANRSYRKELGARVGCHLALEEKVAALICLGYHCAAEVIGEAASGGAPCINHAIYSCREPATGSAVAASGER